MKDSKDYYNSIANEYNEQSKERIHYLNAVDAIVIGNYEKRQITNYLDIGAGDGRRGLKIAKALNIKNITLLDNSDKMLNSLASFSDVDVVDISIFDFNTTETFDLITCLWNVVGHFPSEAYRQLFFKKVSNLLSDNGVLIFDVNNRYNIQHYGNESVMANMKNDYLNEGDTGWFALGEKECQTKVYIHSPFDIYEYLKSSDLILDATFYVDYKSGEIKETFFEGQLIYKLIKK